VHTVGVGIGNGQSRIIPSSGAGLGTIPVHTSLARKWDVPKHQDTAKHRTASVGHRSARGS